MRLSECSQDLTLRHTQVRQRTYGCLRPSGVRSVSFYNKESIKAFSGVLMCSRVKLKNLQILYIWGQRCSQEFKWNLSGALQEESQEGCRDQYYQTELIF